VASSVGVGDLSAFSKFEVSGPDAEAFVETLGANRPPRTVGRIGLTHVLTPAGGVMSEFTVTRLAADRYYLTSAAFAERHDEDALKGHAAGFADVTVENRTEALGILGVMGPKARDLLAGLTDVDLSNTAFPWLSAQEIELAGVAVRALRVSYVGELGWELHAALADMKPLFDAIMQAGAPLGIRPFGAFAMNAMRLEKGYRAMGAEFTTERTPTEAGVGFLVKANGRTFRGRDAMLTRDAADSAWRMELLELENREGVSPYYAHTVLQDGAPVGIVTSAAFGHRTGRMLALAYLKPEAGDSPFEVSVLGETVGARILAGPPYEPSNARLRGEDT